MSPLSGVRVLDLTRLLPGPMAAMHLADMGAEVIKIEDPAVGDYGRSMGPADPRPGHDALLFQLVNRNKKSLVLDLKQSGGVEVLLDLAAGADLLLEGFRPGVMDRLGVGFDVLRARNPRLVMCSITGYGQHGPWAERAGHDINYVAMSGVLDQIGARDGPPVVPNFQLADLLGGALAPLAGMLAALFAARGSGQGCHLDCAMSDALLAHAVFPFLSVLAEGAVTPRGEGMLSGGLPCYNVYATGDGRWLAVGALEEKFWTRLCETIARPDLLPFRDATGSAGTHARAQLAQVFASRDFDHWCACFDAVDCCVTPVLTLQEAVAHAHFRARRTTRTVAGMLQFAPPFGLPDDARVGTAAPARGADSEAILRELGLSAERIAALRAAGAVA